MPLYVVPGAVVPATMSVSALKAGRSFDTLLEMDMDVGVFASDWSYCDRISSYVARMISHNRLDSLLYSNLFSSALNELLETVFRIHAPHGRFACAVLRSGNVDRVRLRVPCDVAHLTFYRDAVDEVCRADAAERYRAALLSSGPLSPFIGLLELATDYGAGISVEAHGDDTIFLIADLVLEAAES